MLRQGIARGAWLITLAPGLLSAGALATGLAGADAVGDAAAAPDRDPAAARIECPAPRTLTLRRFEDRSAQLLCAGRVIVRVSVPG